MCFSWSGTHVAVICFRRLSCEWCSCAKANWKSRLPQCFSTVPGPVIWITLFSGWEIDSHCRFATLAGRGKFRLQFWGYNYDQQSEDILWYQFGVILHCRFLVSICQPDCCQKVCQAFRAKNWCPVKNLGIHSASYMNQRLYPMFSCSRVRKSTVSVDLLT